MKQSSNVSAIIVHGTFVCQLCLSLFYSSCMIYANKIVFPASSSRSTGSPSTSHRFRHYFLKLHSLWTNLYSAVICRAGPTIVILLLGAGSHRRITEKCYTRSNRKRKYSTSSSSDTSDTEKENKLKKRIKHYEKKLKKQRETTRKNKKIKIWYEK